MNLLEKILTINPFLLLTCYRKDRHLIPHYGTRLEISRQAKLRIPGRLMLNANARHRNGRTTILRMDKNSELEVKGNFSIFYGGDIKCFEGGKITLGSGYCNSNLRLSCFSRIVIGNGVAIAPDVTIMDSDSHFIVGAKDQMVQPVEIGDNVWIGTKSVILKGVHIGSGAVIAAGSVVTRDVPANSLSGGVPSRVIKENIEWRR